MQIRNTNKDKVKTSVLFWTEKGFQAKCPFGLMASKEPSPLSVYLEACLDVPQRGMRRLYKDKVPLRGSGLKDIAYPASLAPSGSEARIGNICPTG